MDRNSNGYAEIDTIDTPRSTWERTSTHKTTFNAGVLVPVYFNEDIIPGTTIKNTTSFVVRSQTPMKPVMDNLILDYYWFSAPKWWYWVHFKDQMGENKLGANWSTVPEYTTPQINVTTAYGVNDLATYMGVPIGVTGFKYDRLGINFYCDIWNSYFRSQVLQTPIAYDTSDNDITSDNSITTGYGLLKVCRTHDYFSSGLVEGARQMPGTNSAVTLPLGTTAPVYGNGNALVLSNGTDIINWRGAYAEHGLTQTQYSSNGANPTSNVALGTNGSGAGVNWDSKAIGVASKTLLANGMTSGLSVDLSSATAATLSALYLANATQQLMQEDAMYGTLYRDLLRGYGSNASSMETMIPEYLGGQRVPMNMEQVAQQSETTSTSPLGDTGAFSLTASSENDFTKSWSMHTMIFCLVCVRVMEHTYQQGLARQFSRERRLDHYHPLLAHIANQPVYNREIFLQADTVVNSDGTPVNNDVFNYKEAWQEYMYDVNRISGELLSTYSQSLDVWHYGDDYATMPTFDDQWIVENKDFIDRTLAVQSSEAHQFIGDFRFTQTVSAPIPFHRHPGLSGFRL